MGFDTIYERFQKLQMTDLYLSFCTVAIKTDRAVLRSGGLVRTRLVDAEMFWQTEGSIFARRKHRWILSSPPRE